MLFAFLQGLYFIDFFVSFVSPNSTNTYRHIKPILFRYKLKLSVSNDTANVLVLSIEDQT